MASICLNSAGGVIALLDESNPTIKHFALLKLDDIVDEFWTEISEVVDKIEVLYEDEHFADRQLAALISSKVYYHLGAYEDAMNFALGAGDRFDVSVKSEYVDTILSQCLDEYVKLRIKIVDEQEDIQIDNRLEAIVNRMFLKCFEDQKYKLAAGMALEVRRVDFFEDSIKQSEDTSSMLVYCMKIVLSLIDHRGFRSNVLGILVRIFLEQDTLDYVLICQCYVFLDDYQAVSQILENLMRGNENDILFAYQIGFDLYENATQSFLTRVIEPLTSNLPNPEYKTPVKTDKEAATGETGEDSMETETAATPITTSVEMTTRLSHFYAILCGNSTIALQQEFLIRNNHTDMQILKNIKDFVRYSITHNATIISNALMSYGTTSDVFLRSNLDWLGKAQNWAKFTATGSLGLIHWGHEGEALKVMSTYLPKDSSGGGGGVFAEGGSLYALGLIHANHGHRILEYLQEQLTGASNEVIQHGGCLGLGLAAMGTARADVFDLLLQHLHKSEAVIGEAAGLAMGLVMLGTANEEAVREMIEYAKETPHEKILRGLAIGISLVMFGTLDDADVLIETLCSDKDPLLRRSGIYTIAMAYCGTGNNKAIRRLLHVAVSDVDDDVRRAAVMCLGFILFQTPDQCPNAVSLLSESYNPHVRCGASLALGIACAGTGNREALSLLETLTDDQSNFVRQNAHIASAMILIQQSDASNSKLAKFRENYIKVVSDKHEDNVTKFGAIMAQGILGAGGRNVTITLKSRSGHVNSRAAVGLLVFTHFWFWFPLSHFISLAFVPTSLIAINSDLKMPKIQFKSNANPNLFAYPPPVKKEQEKVKSKVATAILSISAKGKKAKKGEEVEKPEEAKEGAERDQEGTSDPKEEVKSKPEVEGTGDMEIDTTPPKVEATSEMLSNPARVLPKQLQYISLEEECKYSPTKSVAEGGIILMRHLTPGEEEEELIEKLRVILPGEEDEGQEPEPPEPFDWDDDFLD